ncbi:Uncharacterised protein [uncultured archaeon]|nr:Uncharacterised protein [uncultured archaeon]
MDLLIHDLLNQVKQSISTAADVIHGLLTPVLCVAPLLKNVLHIKMRKIVFQDLLGLFRVKQFW